MITIRKHILLLSCILTAVFAYSQSEPELSAPQLNFSDNKLNINYDILNTSQEHRFRVWIEVTDSRGYVINARSLSGDIGNNITGGRNKTIVWDLQQDNINIDDELFVQVLFEITARPEAPVVKEEPEKPKQEKSYSMAKSLVFSALYPGLGLKLQDKSNLHLLKGLAAYGCLAGSLVLSNQAESNYNKYLEEFDIDTSNSLYDKTIQQDNTSKILLYTAIGIWVVDLVWTGVATSKENASYSANSGFSFGADYSAQLNTTFLTFTYSF